MKAILLDIEGTTAPVDFVHKTLFPYSHARMADYVRANFDDLTAEIAELQREYRSDFQSQIYGRNFHVNSPEEVAHYLQFLIEIDRKSIILKRIQGEIWKVGYESGELKSQLYPDVNPSFMRWHNQEISINIYSSGSILAQKLIFKYSETGDLTPFIKNFFDTNTGGKRQPESYRRIAQEIGFKPSEILFVSDVTEELDAAKTVGMKTLLSVRDRNANNPSDYSSISTFSEI